MQPKSNPKLEYILELLNPHCNSNLPITKFTLNNLKREGLNAFYDFIIKPKIITDINEDRPLCPVIKNGSCSLARYPYKNGMNKYISQWGYEFENIYIVSTSLLEATANYLEKQNAKTIH